MLKIRKILLCLTASILASCGSTSISAEKVENNSNKTVNTDIKKAVSITSVKDAMINLKNSKNYTINLSKISGPLTLKSKLRFTETGFFDDFLGDEFGFYASDDGVYSFDYYNRRFTASKLLTDEEGNVLTSIWGNDLFYSFASVAENDFQNANGKTFSVSSKRAKLLFMNLLGISQAQYSNMNDIVISVGDDMNSVTFEVSTTTGTQVTCSISDFGTTKIDVIDNYVADGNSYFKVDETMNHILDLFSNFNYTRIVYDLVDYDTYTVVGGHEFFTKDYFYAGFTSEYVSKMGGAAFSNGVVGIDHTFGPIDYADQTGVTFEFLGSYYIYLIDTNNDGVDDDIQLMTRPINVSPDVTTVFNYPTYLKMFEDNQYLLNAGVDGQYYTSEYDCIIDFVNNFQLAADLQSNSYIPSGVHVEYYEQGNATYAETQGKETVVFKLDFEYYGATGSIDYVFTDFNSTKVDLITQENVYGYIQDILDSYVDANPPAGSE